MGPWRRRLLLTGPIAQIERYERAARDVGWEPFVVPLLTVHELEVDPSIGLERDPDWICVTSRNAVPALGRTKALLRVPCATVGRTTAALLRELGYSVEIEGVPSAAALVEALIPHLETGALVMWPRGRLATELSSRLREFGICVTAPVVYDTSPRALEEPLPECDAVFFASPSAVEAYLEHADAQGDGRRVAIGIGPTTWGALEQRAGRFARNLVLENPDSESLGTELARLLPT
jgi:uroporphyrinogen-III synthase